MTDTGIAPTTVPVCACAEDAMTKPGDAFAKIVLVWDTGTVHSRNTREMILMPGPCSNRNPAVAALGNIPVADPWYILGGGPFRHSRCKNQHECTGPGCVLLTGKTRAKPHKPYYQTIQQTSCKPSCSEDNDCKHVGRPRNRIHPKVTDRLPGYKPRKKTRR